MSWEWVKFGHILWFGQCPWFCLCLDTIAEESCFLLAPS